MRTYYQALADLRAAPTLETAATYLHELLAWFSHRLPVENPTRLAKQCDRDWQHYVVRAPLLADGSQLQTTMFRQGLAQLPVVENMEAGIPLFRLLFAELRWNYDEYVNPEEGDDCIVAEIGI